MSLGALMHMSKKVSLMGIDTNVLIYFLNSESKFHKSARDLFDKLQTGKIMGVISWQNLSELYAVITDVKRFPKYVTSIEGVEIMDMFLKHDNIKIVLPNNDTKKVFFNLISKTKPKNQQIHDVFLAATLLSNDVTTLITENAKDFAGIRGLEAKTLGDF